MDVFTASLGRTTQLPANPRRIFSESPANPKWILQGQCQLVATTRVPLPLRHALNPSLGRSVADIPVGSRSQGEKYPYPGLSLWILVVSGPVTLGVTGVAEISLPGFHHLLPILQSTGHIPIHPCPQYHSCTTSGQARGWYYCDQR